MAKKRKVVIYGFKSCNVVCTRRKKEIHAHWEPRKCVLKPAEV